MQTLIGYGSFTGSSRVRMEFFGVKINVFFSPSYPKTKTLLQKQSMDTKYQPTSTATSETFETTPSAASVSRLLVAVDTFLNLDSLPTSIADKAKQFIYCDLGRDMEVGKRLDVVMACIDRERKDVVSNAQIAAYTKVMFLLLVKKELIALVVPKSKL